MGRIDSLRKTDQEAGGRQNSEFRSQEPPPGGDSGRVRLRPNRASGVALACDVSPLNRSQFAEKRIRILFRQRTPGSWLLAPDFKQSE
jgi:hypothetical protein